jgi:hypothetical protein
MFGARRLSLDRLRIGCRVDAQHRADSLVLSSQFSEKPLQHLASWSSCIRIYAALDFCDAFGVAVDHSGDCDRASYEECYDRARFANSFSAQHDKSFTTIILVELTGIEPVASWLQTRRSPS